MILGHALSTQVCYYSLLLNVPDFNAADIFLLDVGGKATWASLTVSTLSGYRSNI